MNYDAHPQLDRLAAEYVLGTMPARARRRFEAVVHRSPAAQAAIDAWSDRLHLLSQVDFALEPSPAVFARIERRLDRSARASSPGRAAGPGAWGWSWLRPAAGFALGVLVTLGATLLLQPPAYETLTTAPSGAPQQRQLLRVLLDPGTTVEQLNAALRTVGASVVAGPTEIGMLTVTIPNGQPLEPALATLRTQPGVRLAEPVVAPRQPR